ncbi:MAG: hypothetical protein DWQ44_00155 [Bacteroidetes bacterium]|nr:MAG: hypothetical protein DWQ33_05105 [Bacteroidota bacterium]REK06042.1 MAG: hypothetical protein DWQ39_04245 [Bacteroidota bacterium]REK37100.1 MAG: hypothetical protein DWQ44_00155 [Bacteroidota bacterium]REK47507.1 MAG: hypothetical protein DWQ48_12290 [Bacteroidota bacterium]
MKLKAKHVFLFLLAAGGVYMLSSFKAGIAKSEYSQVVLKNLLRHQTDSVIKSFEHLASLAVKDMKKEDSESLRLAFKDCRNLYKTIEGFIIHFFNEEAVALNSPDMVVPDEEDEITPMREPIGIQVLERYIFNDTTLDGKLKRSEEISRIISLLQQLPEFIQASEMPEHEFFNAVQLQLLNIFLIGVTNMETPFADNAFAEARAMLHYKLFLFNELYRSNPVWEGKLKSEFTQKLNLLSQYLMQMESQELPDYFTLYSQFYIPFSDVLNKSRFMLMKDPMLRPGAVNFTASSIFDPAAFNTNHFLPGRRSSNRANIAELGKQLFFDPALSLNNQRSCASCHQPEKAFTDGLPKSIAIDRSSTLTRNAPTLINSVLQRKLFHDGRAFTFENQASEVLNNPAEMHGDFTAVAFKLRKSDEYVKLFREAFRGEEDTLISNRTILAAIAEYERTLIGLNSRFDQSIRGHANLLSNDEIAGFNLFMGKADCASCHFLPLFGGTVPPNYFQTELEVLGVPANSDLNNPLPDPDSGRASTIPMPFYYRAFKTSTVRNVEHTAPYMHNGVFERLEDVMEFYNRGGGQGIGLDIPNQTLSSDSLHLTETEIAQIISFMKSLSDTAFLTSRPARLPSFPPGNELNSRVSGGEY